MSGFNPNQQRMRMMYQQNPGQQQVRSQFCQNLTDENVFFYDQSFTDTDVVSIKDETSEENS